MKRSYVVQVVCGLCFCMAIAILGVVFSSLTVPAYGRNLKSFAAGAALVKGDKIYYVESNETLLFIEDIYAESGEPLALTDKGILKLRGKENAFRVGQEVCGYLMPDGTYSLGHEDVVAIVRPGRECPETWIKVESGQQYSELYTQYAAYKDYGHISLSMAISLSLAIMGIWGVVGIIRIILKYSKSADRPEISV